MFERTNPRNFLPPRRKGAKESAVSFRPKGEILVSSKARNLLLRSLAFARDDGPRARRLASLPLCASHLFSDPEFLLLPCVSEKVSDNETLCQPDRRLELELDMCLQPGLLR